MSWFDLENNSWGESEGVPPPRLLSGAVSLQDRIYLIGSIYNLIKMYRSCAV